MTNEINHENCKGCRSFGDEYCIIFHISTVYKIPKECPCVNCIVKSMCLDICSERTSVIELAGRVIVHNNDRYKL